MKSFGILLSTLLSAVAPEVSGQSLLSGTVFADRNGNGLRERGERGLGSIPVSNGDTIVLTDRRGHFTLQACPEQRFFVLAPSGWRIVEPEAGAACRCSPEDSLHDASQQELTFALTRCEEPRRFRMAAVGDLQVADSVELAYARRTILSELAGRGDLAFSLMLGDLVNDDPRMMPAVADALGRLPHPVRCLVGNHDRDVVPRGSRLPRGRAAFSDHFGAADYAFDYGPVRFIILDNTSSGYRFSDRQLRLVRQLLRLTPAQQPLVLAFHVPLASTANGDALLALLGGRSALILSAHLHSVVRRVWAPGVVELTVGAPCGSWWVGERDPDAVPVALQQCGAPRNYFTIDFSEQGYTLTFKGVGLDASRQAEVWIAGEEPLDRQIPALAELPEGYVAVNLYGGCEETLVEMRVDDGPWVQIFPKRMVAPTVSRIAWWNRHGGYPTCSARRIPLRRVASPHLWAAQLPADAAAGSHRLQIRARDPYGLNVELERLFALH